MMKKNILGLIVFFCVLSLGVAAERNNSGIIFGNKHMYLLAAPKGWVLDNESGKNNGLQAVFYPEGGSWQKSSAVMYTNAYLKNDKAKTVEDYIQMTKKTFEKEGKRNIVIEKEKSIVLKNGKTVEVRLWKGNLDNTERVAYIDEKFVIAIVVLSSRDIKDFEKSNEAFEELVNSYLYVSDNNGKLGAASEKEIKALKEISTKQAEIDENSKYEKKISDVYGPSLGSRLRECVEDLNLKDGKIPNFDLIFVINQKGVINSLYYTEKMKIAECVATRMRYQVFFPPPKQPNYHLHLDISFN